MKKYSKYKDSGVEWLGEIPEHWTMSKVAHSFSLIGSGTTPKAGSPEFYENGTIKWINTGDLNDNLLLDCTKCVTKKAIEDFSSLKIHPTGSLIIAMYGATIGKVAIMTFDACTNQACCVLNGSDKLLIKFAFYWFQSNKSNIISLSFGGGQPNISQDIIRNLRICTPPIIEQHSIVSFLDEKVLQIDSLIEKKRKMIELLKEERAAIINQAVTKGINPDAEMKDSGIEWLGEVPKHWEVKRLKYSLELITLKQPESSIKKIALENIESKTGKFIETESDFAGEGTIFQVDDILFGKLRPYLAKVLLAEFEGNAVGDIFVYRANRHILPKFAFYRLLSDSFIEAINGSTYGAKMPRASSEFIGDLLFPYPPVEEQQKIVKYIESHLKIIENTTDASNMEITLLEEYRTALINEAVTGKIDVRGL